MGAFSQNSNSTENSTLQNFYVSTLGVLQSMAGSVSKGPEEIQRVKIYDKEERGDKREFDFD